MALSLQDVAEHTGSATPAAAEHMVLDQVAKGGVSATIDDVAQMVYFDDDRMDNQIGCVLLFPPPPLLLALSP